MSLKFGTFRSRSPRSEGFAEWFVNGEYSHALEATWKEVEDGIPSALEAVAGGTLFSDLAAVDTIKGMLAVHIVRSKRLEAVWQNIYAQQLRDGRLAEITRLLEMPDVLEALHLDQTGLHAVSVQQLEEARNVFTEELELHFRPGGTYFAQELVRQYERTRSYLNERALEIGRSTGPELLISDNPVVTPEMSTRRVDAPLGAADSFVLPIGPTFVAAAGGTNRYVNLQPRSVTLLNEMQLASAVAKVYTRPESDLVEWARTRLSR